MKKLKLSHAIFWILLITVCVSGIPWATYAYFLHSKQTKIHNSAYNITALIQTTTSREPLKTLFLAEVLQLSTDRPTNLFAFSSQEAGQLLVKQPVIKQANIKKIVPSTLHISYSMRQPVAFLGDYSNTALDIEAIPFPFKPFYTPKILPKIYLGKNELKDFAWGNQINSPLISVAYEIIHSFSKGAQVSTVDLSRAFAKEWGRKEIVVTLSNQHILRLPTKNFQKQIDHYWGLQHILLPKDFTQKQVVVDLRLPDFAYVMSP